MPGYGRHSTSIRRWAPHARRAGRRYYGAGLRQTYRRRNMYPRGRRTYARRFAYRRMLRNW
jgi:hypothetical protein